jgi:Arc/MetJ-type ribon-helix-helix transcriptional regulator
MVAKIELPPDIAETVRVLVSDGDYPDFDSVIREAFVLLERQRESARLWESILAADRSIEEGHAIPWNEETKARIIANANEKFKKGIPPNPDVIP